MCQSLHWLQWYGRRIFGLFGRGMMAAARTLRAFRVDHLILSTEVQKRF